MRITPSELRPVRRRDMTLRSARLGPVGAILAELPASGSSGTTLEDPCRRSHWAVVVRGDLSLARGRNKWELAAGQAFYVPAGDPPHRFFAPHRVLVAGFVPLTSRAAERDSADVTLASRPQRAPALGEIDAESAPAGPWVMTRSAFGARSGFGSTWCDLPHWGVIIAGNAVIEYENDVEVLGSGDFFYCRPGPPGHKLEVADAAVVVDFTPRDAVASAGRIGDWRQAAGVLQAAG